MVRAPGRPDATTACGVTPSIRSTGQANGAARSVIARRNNGATFGDTGTYQRLTQGRAGVLRPAHEVQARTGFLVRSRRAGGYADARAMQLWRGQESHAAPAPRADARACAAARPRSGRRIRLTSRAARLRAGGEVGRRHGRGSAVGETPSRTAARTRCLGHSRRL